MKRTAKLLEERRVFAAFVKVCPYGIKPAANRWPSPPKPDVITTTTLGQRAFELAQAIDSRMAKALSMTEKFQKYCCACLAHLPQNTQRDVKARYANADIRCSTTRRLKKRELQKTVSALVHLLTSLQADPGNALDISQIPELNNAFDRVKIYRGMFNGPLFHITTSLYVRDAICNIVKEKFNKRYCCRHPIDLLVYYDLTPAFPYEVVRTRLRKYAEAYLPSSPFERVWVFDMGKKIVKDVIPPLATCPEDIRSAQED